MDDLARNNNGILVQDSTNIFNSRGSSDFEARHRFVANAIYALPFKGNRIVSGWELAPIVTFQTGNPFTIVIATANVNAAPNTIRPNLIAPVQISGNPAQWITNAGSPLAIPTNSLGNRGRDARYGPGLPNCDLPRIDC